MQHRCEQVDVGIWFELEDLADLWLDPSGVNEADGSPSRLDRANGSDWVGHREEGTFADARIRSKEQKVVGVLNVGDEMNLRTSPKHLGHRELVGTVLASCCEQAGRTKHGDEQRE